MARQKITFGRLWIDEKTQQAFERFARAALRFEVERPPWPINPDTEIEIEPSKFAEGGLFVYVGKVRYHLPPGTWRLDH